MTLRDDLVRNLRQALLVLQGAVCFVLLIACANMANLLLARSAGRRKELSIRSALGAGRFDLARQALTESMVLSVAGDMRLRLASLARSFSKSWGQLLFRSWPAFSSILACCCSGSALSLATGALFRPRARIAAAPDAIEGLKAGGRSSADWTAHRGVRKALVISQMAVALVLLAGAGLLLRSFARLEGVQPGFEPQPADR